jgi:hypothetical protein
MRSLRTGEARSRRLDSSVCNIFFGALLLLFCILTLSFLATRTHMFHVALMRRQQQTLNNRWLLEQCKAPEFYSNMKHHSSLCDDLVLEQADALWLHALRDVIDDTHPCGELPCALRIERFLEWVLSRGVFLLCAMAASVFVLFLAAVQLQRYVWCERYRMLYGPPGMQHFRGGLPPTNLLREAQHYPMLENEDDGFRTLRIRAGGSYEDI